MKKILLITTGGTIASREGKSGGLTPEISPSELLENVPEIAQVCDFDAIGIMNLDSTNVGPSHWSEMARVIYENYDKYDGFVITHGTDTLSYTAAALSYMIQNSPKPIVLTGSQKSIYLRDTDARRNLTEAFIYAASPYAASVKVVFNSQVILGTRARKTRTLSYNAFDSIDYPVVASLQNGKVINYIKPNREIFELKKAPVFSIKMEPKLFVLKLIPDLNPKVISSLKEIYRILIIEAFGAGGLPNLREDFPESIKEAVYDFTSAGGLVVMTTQVPHEGSNLAIYEVGSILSDNPGILDGGNMTLEAITCKLMWILGQTHDPKKISELFYTPVDFDIL